MDLPHKFTPVTPAASVQSFHDDERQPMEHGLTVNPVEKWRKHGRRPWKMILHVMLLLMYTAMVLAFVDSDVQHISHAVSKFHRVYLGISGSFQDRVVLISTAQDFAHAMHKLQRAYFSLSSKSLKNLQPKELTFDLFLDDGSEKSFNLSDVAPEEVQSAFDKAGFDFNHLGDVSYTHAIAHIPLMDFPRKASKSLCFLWDLNVEIRSVHTGQLDMSLSYTVHACQGFYGPRICLVAGAVAALCFLLECRSIRRWWYAMRNVEGGLACRLLQPEPFIPASTLCHFDPWRLVFLVSNLLQITAAVYATCVPNADIYVRLNLIAVSAALAWVNIVRYLSYCAPSLTLYKTLSVALPKVLQFMVGVIPLFVAYAILGLGLFSFDTGWFGTFSMAFASLFSLMNGDIVHDSYLNLKQTSWPFAQLYLYSFLSLFIYVVLNIFISIVEESFFATVPHSHRALQEASARASELPQQSSQADVKKELHALKLQMQTLQACVDRLEATLTQDESR